MQVRHPHCVQIMAASLDPCEPFIVMEWVPGGNWFDALAADPPPPAHQRIRAVREMSAALQYQPPPLTQHSFSVLNMAWNRYLHDPLIGIVHGDIKSLNVLIMHDGSSKVQRALL